MIEKQIVINNQLINYRFAQNSGKTDAQTVVFLHGWRSDSSVWEPVIERLLRPSTSLGARNDNSVKIYALDLPGFGKSEVPKRPFKLDDYKNIVKSFIEKMGAGNIVLAGHSFGGRIAIKLAALHRPAAQKLVLVDSAGFHFGKKKKALYRAVAKLVKPFFALPGVSSLRPKIYKMIGAEDYIATPELKETFVNIIREDLTALLPAIKQETLIIWGGKDTETPMMLGLLLNEQIRNSKLVTFSNAGHFSFLDEEEKFVSELGNFINEPI